jgi:hypothetical protein
VKITFADRSYLEISKSLNPGKYMVSIAAKHPSEKNSTIVNSVEVSVEDLKKLLEEIV